MLLSGEAAIRKIRFRLLDYALDTLHKMISYEYLHRCSAATEEDMEAAQSS